MFSSIELKLPIRLTGVERAKVRRREEERGERRRRGERRGEWREEERGERRQRRVEAEEKSEEVGWLCLDITPQNETPLSSSPVKLERFYY